MRRFFVVFLTPVLSLAAQVTVLRHATVVDGTGHGIVNLSDQGRKSGVVPNKQASFSSLILGTRHLSPLVKRPASQDAVVRRFHAVTAQPEQVANRSMA